MEKNELLQQIRRLSFAKDETILFLDTHPGNTAALNAFYDYREKLKALTEQFEAEYGPLTANGVRDDRWTWIEGQWPWQRPGDRNDLGDTDSRRGGR